MTETDTTPPSTPWGRHALPTDEPAHLRVGPLDLWLRREEGEVLLAREESADEARIFPELAPPAPPDPGPAGDGTPAPAEDTVWSRWAVEGEPGEILLEPVFPDRPVIAQPEAPFRLLQGAEARIFVRVPLWVRIRLPGPDGPMLEEVPTMTLSNTWFGSFTDGELCYWLHTSARREVSGPIFGPHLAVCPVHLENRSGEELEVSKLALRVVFLSVFRDADRLWADETRVRYSAAEEGSHLEVTGKPPGDAPGSTKVGGAREPFRRGFTAKTFHRLWTLSTFGVPG